MAQPRQMIRSIRVNDPGSDNCYIERRHKRRMMKPENQAYQQCMMDDKLIVAGENAGMQHLCHQI